LQVPWLLDQLLFYRYIVLLFRKFRLGFCICDWTLNQSRNTFGLGLGQNIELGNGESADPEVFGDWMRVRYCVLIIKPLIGKLLYDVGLLLIMHRSSVQLNQVFRLNFD
jgi:hypothetical protein